MTPGEMFRKWREERELSQTKASYRLETPSGDISRYEGDKLLPSLPTFARIVLGLDEIKPIPPEELKALILEVSAKGRYLQMGLLDTLLPLEVA